MFRLGHPGPNLSAHQGPETRWHHTGLQSRGAFCAGLPTAKLLGHSCKACWSLSWGRTFTASGQFNTRASFHYALQTLWSIWNNLSGKFLLLF